jgi:Sodium/hydrogen exchanger family/TrkA-N domain
LALRVGVGAAIGITGGWSLGWFLKRSTFLNDDLKTLVVLATVWGLFGAAQLLRSEAGLMAMVTAGIMLRSSELPEERLLKRFKGQLTTLSVSVLFILLSADLSIPSLLALGWEGVWTVLAIMLVVRPVSILLCTLQSGLGWRQKIFLAWIAPRGIVSASVASLFAIVLTDQGINGGDSIKALVFLTIILTVFLQASTAQLLANVLRLNAADRQGLVIVGLNPVSVLITRLFLERGETIAILDTAPDESDLRSLSEIELRSPEQLRILKSTAWDATVLEQAGLATVGTFLAMTDNAEVNTVLAQRSIDEFSPPRVLAVFPRDAEAIGSTIQTAIQPAFSSQSNLKLWNQYLQDDAVRLGQVDLDEGLILQLGRLVDQERVMPLLVERRNSLQQNSLQVVPGDWDWQAGDRLTYLLHEPKPQLMKLLSGTAQPKLLVEEAPGF